ncbi:MAG TPA: SGNH/GDSL hydrolase family protein [Opitutus sp.]|nr:SGNH/GDSL hydrolase family protein [Opitutus sp.]
MVPRFLRTLLLAFPLAFAVPSPASPDHWAKDIDAFTAADAARPPPAHAVLFIGSSSIVKWQSLAEDFPFTPVINRGFGGSELADSVFYADRIAIPYRPRAIVLYAGDNDIAAGKSPEQVAADFVAFRAKIHAALPGTPIFYLSIKYSNSRLKFKDAMARANALIAADCAANPHCTFVDVNSAMLGADGNPRPELFQSDQLHMLPAGYAIWTRILAPLLKQTVDNTR